MFGRMLIPLDGSKTAEEVLPYARRLAAGARVAVELLGVVEMGDIAEDIASNQAAYAGALVREAIRNSTEYLEKLAQTFHDGKVRCDVQQGRPEDIIIAAASADRATLIAMATHGCSGLTRWLLGSVTEKVLRGTVNPLLVVRASGNSKTDGEAALRSLIVS